MNNLIYLLADEGPCNIMEVLFGSAVNKPDYDYDNYDNNYYYHYYFKQCLVAFFGMKN